MKRLLALLPLASVIVAQKAPEPTLLVTMKGDHGSYVDPENPYQVPTDGKHHASLSTAKSNALPASCPDYTDYVQKTTNPPLSSGPLKLPYQRPSPECRTFNSSVVEKVVSDVYKQMTDPDLAQIFRNTFPNTVDTAISYFNKSTTDPLTFVVTGDIPASWFRDTQRELENYHVLAPQDPNLATLLKGAINFQARAININEYCNSFNAPPGSGVPVSSNGQQDTVFPTYSPADVFECKYEIDSLASFLRLSFQYWNATNDYSFIKANNSAWIKAVENTITLVEDQMIPTFSKNGSLNTPFYTFYRLTTAPTDSLDNQGRGNPVSDQMGALVRSQFRPSDDACTFPYFIPGNAMISVELGHLNTLLSSLPISAQTSTTKKLASHADQLSKMIRKGIEQVGTFDHPTFGKVYAYEVDGYGSRIVMDDANIPSLLSLPYIGYLDRNDTTYQNTRNMVLSREGNPYFFEGYGSGIGGPHVGVSTSSSSRDSSNPLV